MPLTRTQIGLAGGFALLAGVAQAQAAGAEALAPGGAREARMQGARNRLVTASGSVDCRKGCIYYTYGCGYGSLSQDRSAIQSSRARQTRW